MAFLQNAVITYAGDAGMLVPEIVAAGGGLLFAFDHSTIAGKIVLTLLAVVSIFSWSIMVDLFASGSATFRIVATLCAVDRETNLENRAIRSGQRESVLLALDV